MVFSSSLEVYRCAYMVHMCLLLKGDCQITPSERGSGPTTIKVTGEPGPPGKPGPPGPSGEGIEGKQVSMTILCSLYIGRGSQCIIVHFLI